MYAKNVKMLNVVTSVFLCCSFVEGETKEPFCFSNIFCKGYFSKTKRKTSEKTTEKCFFLSICSSHAKN